MVTITSKANPSSPRTVQVIFTGPKEEAEKEAFEHVEQNKWGYGSIISSRKELPDGQYQVIVTESNSCD